MTTAPNTRTLDLMKLLVAIVLLVVFVVLLAAFPPAAPPSSAAPPEPPPAAEAPAEAPAEPPAPPAVEKPELPPFPEASFDWSFNADDGALYAPDNDAPLYTLDADSSQWTPVIPANMAASLPDGAELTASDGGWAIQGADGVTLYEWDPAAHSWVTPAGAPAPPAADKLDLPPFPEASFDWSFNPDDGALYAPDSDTPLYTFDVDSSQWMPVIPADLAAELPDGAELTAGDGGWVIQGADGAVLYEWDAATHSWVARAEGAAAEPAAAAEQDADCAAVLPARLEAGMQANVLSTVNMRSEAGIADNILRANPPGSQLEVTGASVCTPHMAGAYRWWPVLTGDGAEGWTAEGTLNGSAYFLEPVE